MTEKKTMVLCRPCAEDAKKVGWRLAALDGRTEKRECGCCGFRRFTLVYDMEREAQGGESNGT